MSNVINLAVLGCLVALLTFSKDPEKRVLLWSLVLLWGLVVFAVFGMTND
jgi:hypothetical protein